jgi:hypothetical protein
MVGSHATNATTNPKMINFIVEREIGIKYKVLNKMLF